MFSITQPPQLQKPGEEGPLACQREAIADAVRWAGEILHAIDERWLVKSECGWPIEVH
jgi:hypothetical protein